MAETSFTTGPWEVDGLIVTDGRRDLFSGCLPPDATDEETANCNLIAAAPELYSTNERAACALLDLVNILRESGSWDQAFLDEVEAEARASFSALAKARGEAA